MNVFLTDTAKRDLKDVIDDYDSHNPAIADHFENELQQRLETLGKFPRIGHAGFAGLLELGFHDFPYILSCRKTKYRSSRFYIRRVIANML
jgi:plasmid stabilization system protein ParE